MTAATEISPASVDQFRALQAYVGTPYRLGEFDCADLARMVQREVFGREIALPEHRRRPPGAAAQRREISSLRDELALRVDVPFTGCGALLFESGPFAPLWHIGTVALHKGETWILHNSEKLGSAHLHRLSDLQRWGMRLEGCYAWK